MITIAYEKTKYIDTFSNGTSAIRQIRRSNNIDETTLLCGDTGEDRS